MLFRYLRYIIASFLLVSVSISHAQDAVQPLNINTANVEQLAEGIKGIGIKKAKRIIEYRENIGGFTSIAQLSDVKGIGVKTIEKNIERLSVE